MIEHFKQQKGKAYDKLPVKTLAVFDSTEYMVSKKYDGNMVFIVKVGSEVRMFTSDWKEFHIDTIADELRSLRNDDFVVIGEFLHNCEGKLGDRTKSQILTTFRTNFNKGIPNSLGDEVMSKVMVFDFLPVVSRVPAPDCRYSNRLEVAMKVLKKSYYLEVIEYKIMSGSRAMEYSKQLVKEGWEGAMAAEDLPYKISYTTNKRVNSIVKLKHRKTADIKCVGVEEGEGKYTYLIGALVLEDSKGRRVSVGSGLTYSHRCMTENYFIGKIIEIEYEQILDTYIQPTFVCVRDDKTKSD